MSDFSNAVEIDATDAKTTYSVKGNWNLGTRASTGDGRVYRYCLNGATALVQGVPVTTAAIEVLDKDTEYTAGINDTQELTSTWRSIKLDAEAATKNIAANEYAEGYIRIANSTVYTNVKGQLIRIKSHNATATTSTDALGSTMTVVFADGDQLTTTLDTGAIVTVHHNPYYAVVAAAGGTTMAGGVVGVPNVPVAANYYFWAQTWGVCACRQDTALLVTGERVIVSTSTSDAVAPALVSTSTDAYADIAPVGAVRQSIGWAMGSPGTDALWGLIFLTISP